MSRTGLLLFGGDTQKRMWCRPLPSSFISGFGNLLETLPAVGKQQGSFLIYHLVCLFMFNFYFYKTVLNGYQLINNVYMLWILMNIFRKLMYIFI